MPNRTMQVVALRVRLSHAVLAALFMLAHVSGCPVGIDTLMEGTSTGFGSNGAMRPLRMAGPIGQEIWHSSLPGLDPNLVITVESLSIRMWRDAFAPDTGQSVNVALRHHYDGQDLVLWKIAEPTIPLTTSPSDILDVAPVMLLRPPPDGHRWDPLAKYVVVIGVSPNRNHINTMWLMPPACDPSVHRKFCPSYLISSNVAVIDIRSHSPVLSSPRDIIWPEPSPSMSPHMPQRTGLFT